MFTNIFHYIKDLNKKYLKQPNYKKYKITESNIEFSKCSSFTIFNYPNMIKRHRIYSFLDFLGHHGDWYYDHSSKLKESKGSKMEYYSSEYRGREKWYFVDLINIIYKSLEKTTKKLTYIEPLEGSLNMAFHIAKPGNAFHILADYCAQFQTIEKETRYALNKNILRTGGIYWITTSALYKNIEQEKRKLKKLIEQFTNYEFIRKPIEYQDSSPMITTIIKRIK